MYKPFFLSRKAILTLSLALFTGGNLIACDGAPPNATESPSPKQAIIPSSTESNQAQANQTTSETNTIQNNVVPNGKGIVIGTIIDASGSPINNATVTLQPTLQQMQSFDNGNYEFKDLEPGNYTIVVNKDNFETSKEVFQLDAGKSLPLDVKIVPKGIKGIKFFPENAKRLIISSPLQLKAEVEMKNGDIDNRVHWKTSDPSLATVDENGIIRGLKEGKVTISALSQQNSSILKEVELDIIKHTFIITGAGQLDVNSKSKLFAEPPSDDLFKNANYTWQTSDPSILKITVNEAAPTIATMEGMKNGVVTVTATLNTKDPDTSANISLKSQELSLTVGSGNF